MQNKLAEALVTRGVLKVGTEVEAYHQAVGLGGVTTVKVANYFTIASVAVKTTGNVVFTLAALRDGALSQVLAEDIINIDGMDPARFAAVWDIKADGGKAVVGARRGRKPKDRSPEGLAKAAALAAAKVAANVSNDDFAFTEVA